MSDSDPNLDLSEEPAGSSFPWKNVILAVLAVAFLAAFWIWYSSSSQKSTAQITALEKELDADSAALQAEKDKILQLTQQLDKMKQDILAERVQDHKKAVAEYNKLAAQQRAEREQYKAMADQYNQKVSKLHELQP